MLFFIDIAGDEVKINNVHTLLNKVSSRVQQLVKEGRIKDNMFEDIVDENGDCVGEWEYMNEQADNANYKTIVSWLLNNRTKQSKTLLGKLLSRQQVQLVADMIRSQQR